ncbi:LysR family transcriptional regulator [Luteolibacter ambystomatis]|uniref:LysR family transcriptional regulator n=1 Tax=Luteolibacter ambystomatis TaxID=2824561 RepID=A0A975J074_9BACT|nr:LysR family transcriptional regulator [Luteolibacter ambystomatis]QUE51607.1 LysR family transcriptional regulator [Luteolibacter ambystomatis]
MSEFLPDLRQVRAFVAVADEGSFTLAAKRLCLTQSAISHSLRALEEQLGCRLLDRQGKKTVPTQEGEVFIRRCRRALAELEHAERELDGLKRWGQARIRVGAPHSLCHFLLPTVLREFRDCFPRCEPVIEAGDTSWLMTRLEEHALDIVVGLGNETQLEDGRPLFSDEMTFIVSPAHPWANGGKITPDSLAAMHFIVYTRSTQTHRLVENWFEQQGVRLRAPLVLGDMEAIKEMTRIGLGVGIVAPWVARKELADGRLVSVPMGEVGVRRDWSVFTRVKRNLTLVEETFVGICGMIGKDLARQTAF